MKLSQNKQKVPGLREFMFPQHEDVEEVRKYLVLLESRKKGVGELGLLGKNVDLKVRINCLFAGAVMKAYEKSEAGFVKSLEWLGKELFFLYTMYKDVSSSSIVIPVPGEVGVVFSKALAFLPFAAYSFFGVGASLAVENIKFANLSAVKGAKLARKSSYFYKEEFGEGFAFWLSADAAEFSRKPSLRDVFIFDCFSALSRGIEDGEVIEKEANEEAEKNHKVQQPN
ncbi:MAG: hypothetical protein QW035_01800 [Candidatus Anstonellales archaeon]